VSVRGRRELQALARELGVEVRWRDQDGETRTCSDDTLLATVRMLGITLQRPEDARAARQQLERERAERPVEPVTVAWDGAPPVLTVRLPEAAADDPFEIVVEHGGRSDRFLRDECDVHASSLAEGVVQLEVRLPRGFDIGRHRVALQTAGRRAEATLLAAPARIGRAGLERAWGVFAPVYALHDRDRTHTGDLASLARLGAWASGRGGRVVGTLPILATFVGHGDEPCDPSPYAPVSRRFWNELYLDLRAVPEFAGEPPVLEPSPGRYADLPRLATARRAAVERALGRLDVSSDRSAALDGWLASTPLALEYARFRARVEGSGEPGVRLHAYVQWLMAQQLEALARELAERGQLLYFDLPVGAHRAGFDVVHEGELFIRDASVGAPPDKFFAGGQDWGFPPIHPQITRDTGYAYFATCLESHFRYARALRIDHVMGLHRLWMMAPGAASGDGAYVRYAAEEQWAVVCIEAARHEATVVGENLGTVPAETNRALRRHRALGMWVLEFELPKEEDAIAQPPPAGDLACIDTHDLPTFATWWHDLAPAPRGALVEALRAAGELDTEYGELIAPESVLAATLAWLGRSAAPLVQASLEDLWLEPDPQNIPGADHQDGRFRQRFTFGLDELDTLDMVKDALERLDHARRHPKRSSHA
jgi:4-alpha-glucanotransferase